MDSEQRLRLLAQIDELLDDHTSAEVRSVDGWEGWFVTPGYAPPVPPKRWKMAVITPGALYPLVLCSPQCYDRSSAPGRCRSGSCLAWH